MAKWERRAHEVGTMIFSCLQRANNCDDVNYRPLIIAEQIVGMLSADNIDLLRQHEMQLDVQKTAIYWQSLGDCAANSKYFAQLNRRLASGGYVDGWRDELFSLAESYQHREIARIERAALPIYGARGYGIHINGLTIKDGEKYVWLGKRAATCKTAAAKLDQIAAGGLPAGSAVFAQMQRECLEEASIDYEISAAAIACASISYRYKVYNGVRNDIIFIYDLWLPPQFTPRSNDGEMQSFQLIPLAQIANMLRAGAAIKLNSALVLLDLLIRHGIITPCEPQYATICRLLHR